MAEALLIVDYQNDFTPGIPGGALEVREGDRIADRINELAGSGRYEVVVATRDWHPPDHSSFIDQGGTWPVHCVQGTEGAELDPALDRSKVDLVINKGQAQDTDGYSAFDATGLESLLREMGIDAVTVVGLATDVCVRSSALDALEEGFEVTVDPEAVRGVDLEEGDSERALAEVEAAGASVRRAPGVR